MPFPLNSLTYDLGKRLRELVSPVEAHALQTAAPYFRCFHPIQKCQTVYRVTFSMNEQSVLSIIENPRCIPNPPALNLIDNCFYCVNIIYILSFKLTDSPQLVLDKFRLAPKMVKFACCQMDSSFLQTFATRLEQPLDVLDLSTCSIQSQTVATYACNAFKYLKDLFLVNIEKPRVQNAPSFGLWIDAFLQMNCTTLKYIQVQSDLSVLHLDADKFLAFVKAQHNQTFFMFFYLRYVPNKQEVEKKINVLLSDKHFKRLPASPKIKEKLVLVAYDNDKKYYYSLRK